MDLMDHQAWLELYRHDCVLFDTKSYPHCSNLANSLTQRCSCDVTSHEALFTAIRVNRLYHQTTLRL